MGLVSAVAPLAAQAFGARDPRMVRRALRSGLWAALLISLPIMLSRCTASDPAGAGPGAENRAARAAISVRPGLGRRAGAVVHRHPRLHGRGQPAAAALWITLAAIPVNALLVYLLIYGELGLPRLGLFGAGLATASSISAPCWRGCGLPRSGSVPQISRPRETLAHRLALMRQLVVIGAPISISFLLEYGLFSSAALLMGLISPRRWRRIRSRCRSPRSCSWCRFGISMAATVRVGHAVGRDDPAGVKRAGMVALLLGIADRRFTLRRGRAPLCHRAVLLRRAGGADAAVVLSARCS